jgi:hypothetical protein
LLGPAPSARNPRGPASVAVAIKKPIAAAFAAGRVKDVTVIDELVTIHKKWPRDVVTWLARESQRCYMDKRPSALTSAET